MAKHDKEELNFSWDPPKDDFYKARIKTLERENLELRHSLDREEEASEYSDEMHRNVFLELETRIMELEEENDRLKDALLNAVTRLGWE